MYCGGPLSDVLRRINPKVYKPYIRFALLPSYVQMVEFF
jgi:hypothetical protein